MPAARRRRIHTVTDIEGATNPSLAPEVLGWRQKPELDRPATSVFWSVNTTIGGKPYVQATLLQLNRHGVEKLVWIGDQGYMLSADGLLMPAKKDQPPPDLRYFKR